MLFFWAFSTVLTTACCAVYDYGAYDPTRDDFRPGTFPVGFIWSTATASYQIEGAWNTSGKGESIWDRFSHTPGKVDRGDTGDVACDSYNKYREDVQVMKAMGLKYYRFSLSWPRIFPNGTKEGGVSQDGVNYYNRLIDELIANGIAPMVTLYHWDLPQALQEKYGGWVNEALVGHYHNYATFAFQTFGDRVKFWLTFNEPMIVCSLGYASGEHAPGIQDSSSVSNLRCGHTLLKAHARAWHTYNTTFRQLQGGKVGISLSLLWAEPRDPDLPADVEAADRAMQMINEWFARPIFGDGDYPSVIEDTVKKLKLSMELPELSDEDKSLIRGSADFIGVNHYSTRIAADKPSHIQTQSVLESFEMTTAPEWPRGQSDWLFAVPWGLRRLLKYIKEHYGDPDVYITENGWSDGDVQPPILEDTDRVCYYMTYIDEVLKAIEEDQVKVRAYTAWSFMDNFEWARGYTERFGLHYVNFTDPSRPRTPKQSAKFYSDIIANNGFPEGAEITKMVQDMWRKCRGSDTVKEEL
ncbi:cytosolic beta-glucosidase-like [Branchiostoma lanceolatum]|uniref:cytosolic beta-glucosidase-like n=1 Tax=Branchiostoma lanceolatum TaxID=7740 RepID=UPI0034550C0E